MNVCHNQAHYPQLDLPAEYDARLHNYEAGTPCEYALKKYRTLVIDPPWAYSQKWSGGRELSSRFFKGGTDRGAACMYDVMDQAAMVALPVGEWAEDNAHLYLWTTNAFMLDAYELMKAWGFAY